MRDINGKSVALLGRRPPHFSTGVYNSSALATKAAQKTNNVIHMRFIFISPINKQTFSGCYS